MRASSCSRAAGTCSSGSGRTSRQDRRRVPRDESSTPSTRSSATAPGSRPAGSRSTSAVARWTYAELDARSDELARGLAPGDRVSTLTGNSGEHVALMFACAKAGAILHPISWRLAPAEVAFQLDDAEPALFLIEDEHRDLGEAALQLASVRPALTLAGSSGAVGAAGLGRRPAAPDLHLRDDREAERRAAHARELLLDESLVRSGDRHRARRRRAAGPAPVPLRRLERAVDPRVVEGSEDRARARLRPGARARADRARARHDADGRAGELPLHGAGGRGSRRPT